MLGMMNQPTETLDFYASSPSVRRQLTMSNGSGQNSPKSQKDQPFGSSVDSTDGLLLEVFGERRKPQITYTEDGRRLVNGKLEDTEQPDKLWSRLIVDSVTTTKLRHQGSSGSSDSDEEQQKEEEAMSTNGKQKLRQRFSLGALFSKRTKSTTNSPIFVSTPPTPPTASIQSHKKLQRQSQTKDNVEGEMRPVTCIMVGGSNTENGPSRSRILSKKLSI